MKPEKRILMVCLGNICRSPLAEGIMRAKVLERGLNWEIASAGTGNWHIGQAPDRRGIAAAKALGYDISRQRAQQLSFEMLAYYDHIFVMDHNNLRDVQSLLYDEESKNKISLFLADQQNVTDPYFDNALFEPVCKQIEERCEELIEILSAQI
ncbi:low molecular weight protein-tyrosine-phosphatase [Pedobacter montanisoli]|uniref:protein-tyrosine-phosphatase n=1 Tax=Pedobacter montanisoli TaxID=2923277 RepID=A0ABS9ZTN8_9SPHI|nr:low molecular weight protein-tyrosine-phosphatase [Pedobacter montanisoli]MCJ0741688.1 low molecular weight phosphotyrosine protein phosphatase [Pedobacter montanisoli]